MFGAFTRNRHLPSISNLLERRAKDDFELGFEQLLSDANAFAGLIETRFRVVMQ